MLTLGSLYDRCNLTRSLCSEPQSSGGSRVRVHWVRTPPLRPDACLSLTFLHRQDRISLFNWLFFLMKRALYFATKLNFRDIKKCHCFWVPSNDLFASARKAVFPAPKATGVHRLRNTWASVRRNLP